MMRSMQKQAFPWGSLKAGVVNLVIIDDYPTPGGNKLVNKAFIEYIEKSDIL